MLTASNIQLKTAENSDCEFFYKTRNHPANRVHSLSPENISYSAHQEWFTKNIKNPKNHMFVILFESVPCGYLRLEPKIYETERLEISIAILPEFHHRSIGTKALNLLKEYAHTNGFFPIYALVKRDNAVSQSFFAKCGFFEDEEAGSDYVTFLCRSR